MAVKFTKGTPVRQIVTPIEGIVSGCQFNETTG